MPRRLLAKPKNIIHVNVNTIRSNAKHGTREPVVRLQQKRIVTYGHEVDIVDENGRTVASVVYRPDQPLECGAKVWVETDLNCRVRIHDVQDSATNEGRGA